MQLVQRRPGVVLGPLLQPDLLGRVGQPLLGELVHLLVLRVGLVGEQVAQPVDQAEVLVEHPALVRVDVGRRQLRAGQRDRDGLAVGGDRDRVVAELAEVHVRVDRADREEDRPLALDRVRQELGVLLDVDDHLVLPGGRVVLGQVAHGGQHGRPAAVAFLAAERPVRQPGEPEQRQQRHQQHDDHADHGADHTAADLARDPGRSAAGDPARLGVGVAGHPGLLAADGALLSLTRSAVRPNGRAVRPCLPNRPHPSRTGRHGLA